MTTRKKEDVERLTEILNIIVETSKTKKDFRGFLAFSIGAMHGITKISNYEVIKEESKSDTYN